ncbi:MAG: ABC transporter ATP-binding protein [Desulfonatronovibrionaceae bacterium]
MKNCSVKDSDLKGYASDLEISALSISFPSPAGKVRAAKDVYLGLGRGEALCLAGESGCGKSVLSLAVARLLPESACVSGSVRVLGKDIFSLGKEELCRLRSRRISLIQEQPSMCLNPVMKIGSQVAEAARVSMDLSRRQAKSAALDLLARTGINDPVQRYRHYPHQLSGGMNQRVMIAMALASRPRLLIADEPTTALDPCIQIQLIELLQSVKRELEASLLLITHDLDVARELCSKIAIMYAGQIMECGDIDEVMSVPGHPYSQGMLNCFSTNIPKAIPGAAPPLSNIPTGCAFHPRCPRAVSVCRSNPPPWINGRRCHL